MKKQLSVIFGLLFVLAPFNLAQAFSGSEVSITKDGGTFVSGAKVMQIAGSTFFARLYWGDTYLRFTIKTGNTTKFLRATGEATDISEINEGDLLDASGILESGGNTLNLVATSVRNSSVQKERSTFSGNVVSVDVSSNKFVLDSGKRGVININVSTSTVFTKGNRTLDLNHLKVGDYVKKIYGDYDLSAKTLVAETVVTYVDMSYYKPKLFEGTLEEISGTTMPTSIKVMSGKIQYVVNINNKALILNKKRETVVLSRFVVGDRVRLYGAIREVDEPIIDAEVVRNISL